VLWEVVWTSIIGLSSLGTLCRVCGLAKCNEKSALPGKRERRDMPILVGKQTFDYTLSITRGLGIVRVACTALMHRPSYIATSIERISIRINGVCKAVRIRTVDSLLGMG
jgi:hypothetical protein